MCQILSFLCTCDNAKRSCWSKGASGESSRLSDCSAEEIPATCRASVRLKSNTSSDLVKPEMLTPQRPYSTWHLPVLTSLLFAICCSSQIPCADHEGRWTLPSPAHGHKVSTAGRQREQKNPLHSHSQEEIWLAWKCCVQQAHHHNLDIQTWRTDRPSSTRGCRGPWASFGCLLHLEKHFPPEVLRQSRDWLKWQEISYLLNCFHIFSCVRVLPAAAIETTATDNKTLWAI